jgi:hypothetical protein
MSLTSKRETLARIHGRYQRAVRRHKSRILSEFCATCGYHPKSALRLLNNPLRTRPPKRSGPKVLYDPAEVLPVLKPVWLASDQLSSKRLKAAHLFSTANRRSTAPATLASSTSRDRIGSVAITTMGTISVAHGSGSKTELGHERLADSTGAF